MAYNYVYFTSVQSTCLYTPSADILHVIDVDNRYESDSQV